MPIFKTTKNIFVDLCEYFDENWNDSDKLVLPPKKDWDYKREMQIEDVDIWEQLCYHNRIGIYAAWMPYAEFYLLTTGIREGTIMDHICETYYGPDAQRQVLKRAKELGVDIPVHKIWVEPDELWLYDKQRL
jgi:hypothetical protein